MAGFGSQRKAVFSSQLSCDDLPCALLWVHSRYRHSRGCELGPGYFPLCLPTILKGVQSPPTSFLPLYPASLYSICCVCVSCSVSPTLCDPSTVALCPWDFPGKNTGVVCHAAELRSPALQADSLPSEPPGKPLGKNSYCLFLLSSLLLLLVVWRYLVLVKELPKRKTF